MTVGVEGANLTDLFTWLLAAGPAGHRPEKLGVRSLLVAARAPSEHCQGTLKQGTKPPNAQIGTCNKQGVGSTLPDSIQESKRTRLKQPSAPQQMSAPHEQGNVIKTLLRLFS